MSRHLRGAATSLSEIYLTYLFEAHYSHYTVSQTAVAGPSSRPVLRPQFRPILQQQTRSASICRAALTNTDESSFRSLFGVDMSWLTKRTKRKPVPRRPKQPQGPDHDPDAERGIFESLAKKQREVVSRPEPGSIHKIVSPRSQAQRRLRYSC